MVYVFLADGFEELEALAPVDILRRGGMEVKTVGIGSKFVKGSNNITVECDIAEDEAVKSEELLAVILPGGMPGTINLQSNKTVQEFIDYASDRGLLIGAICAAPLIIGEKGILKGKRATCYCGFEDKLIGADVKQEPVVMDGNIITAYGAGAAMEFGFSLLMYLSGDQQKTDALRKSMRY